MIEKQAATETGTLLGEFPYVRIGSGPENLVILPGTTLENAPPSRVAAWTYRLGFGRFAKNYTVYVINRRRGMPLGYTTQDMAADYASVLEQDLGPSHIMGFSTGGDIPQYVVIDHPAAVRSLILVVSACRLSESTPSLVIGGSEDPFFSEDLLRETAEKLPDATLRLYEGVGHGVPKERKRRYEEDSLAFLDDHSGGSSGQRDRTTLPRAKEMR